ncbi:MAG: LysM peptidoglycan-binding domain-containing protein [Flavobacterium sp.]
MKIRVNRLFLTYIFLLQGLYSFSQSSEYKEHIVVKGESLSQIARQENTDLSIIYQLNPQLKDQILSIGEVVKIPIAGLNQQNIAVNDDFIIVNVEKGESKFALSKKYNVSIQTLEELNPHIKNMLMVGHRVRIPKNNSKNASNQNTSSNGTANNSSVNENDYLVKAGESLWGIAKKFSISLNSLMQANADRLDGVLKTGQYLRIPKDASYTNTGSENINTNISTNDGNGLYHIVVAGETKFGLSKKYQVTIAALEQSNPQIIPMLMVGQKLLIRGASNQSSNQSSNSNIAQVQNPVQVATNVTKADPNDSIELIDYEVLPQETIFSLSKKASMSQDDFVKLNPSLLSGVNIGMKIKMPKSIENMAQTSNVKNIDDSNKPNTNNIENNNQLKFASNVIEFPSNIQYTDLKQNLDFSKELNLTFIFSEDVKLLDESSLQNNESQIAFEQYKGIFLAIDTIQRLGGKVNAHFLNTKANNFKTGEWKTTFEQSDVVIGSYDAFRFEEVISFAKELGKKVIVPTRQDKMVEDYNIIYAYPNEMHQKIFMVNYMKSLNANIIVITDALDSESSNFLRNYDSSIKFAPLDSKGIINNDRFKLLFDKNKINYVVLDTDKNSLIISSTNFLLNESNNFGIKLALFKSRDIINSPNISDIRLKVLQMIYPSVLNPNEAQITKFKELYINKYGKSPSKDSKISFDVALDVMTRLLNKTDNEDFSKLNTTQEHMKFHYQSYKNSFWNAGIFIIKYE